VSPVLLKDPLEQADELTEAGEGGGGGGERTPAQEVEEALGLAAGGDTHKVHSVSDVDVELVDRNERQQV
jgi:hypothetical protein